MNKKLWYLIYFLGLSVFTITTAQSVREGVLLAVLDTLIFILGIYFGTQLDDE